MEYRQLSLEKKLKLYHTALKLKKEKNIGRRKISKILNLSPDLVGSWLYRNVNPINPMFRLEIVDMFRGEKNPAKRIDVRLKISSALRGRKKSKDWIRNIAFAQTRKLIPYQTLKNLYCEQKLSTYEIAQKLNVYKSSVFRQLKWYNIPTRTTSESVRLSKLKRKDELSKTAKENNIINNIFKNIHICPNKIEQKLINLLKKDNLFFRYTGDGSFCVKGFYPDFVNEEKRLIIEVFGDYWHKPKEIKWKSAIFKSANFNSLFIWEHELNKEPEIVIEKIKNFMEAH